MLHTKLHGNRPACSGEEDFFKVFTIYGHGGHLDHVTRTIYTNFGSSIPRRLHINLALIGQVVSEEKMIENVDGQTDGRRRRTQDPWVSYKLTGEPSAQMS